MWNLRKYALHLCLAAAVLACYSAVRGHDFLTLDDPSYIVNNPYMAGGPTLENIVWAFTHFHVANWHPLTWISHQIDCALFGLNPAGHHLVNLAFHVANSVLLLALLFRMTGDRWRSLAVAAVFGLHPLHVESVAWISERKDVLSTFFSFLTLWAYVRYVEKTSWRHYLLVIAMYILAGLSKPMVVTLPCVLLLLDYWPLRRWTDWAGFKRAAPRLILEKLPLFALAAALSVVTMLAQSVGGAVVTLERLSLYERIANAMTAYVQYLWLALWPRLLYAYYVLPEHWPVQQTLGAGAILLGITFYAAAQARRQPYVIVGWLWYLGTLVPVIGLVKAGTQAIADRYTYVPLIGATIALFWSIPDAAASTRRRMVVTAALAGALTLAMSVRTWQQVQLWENSLTLFGHAIDAGERNYRAYHNVAIHHMNQPDWPAAEDCLRQALVYRPTSSDARQSLAEVLRMQHRYEEALEQVRRAISWKPGHAELHRLKAVILTATERPEEALASYREAVILAPREGKYHRELALALTDAGASDEALAHLRLAVQVAPRDPIARNDLATALEKQDQLAEALVHARTAVRLRPTSGIARANLAAILLRLEQYDEAVREFEAALKWAPQDAERHYALGLALEKVARHDEAMAQYEAALRLNPEHAMAHNNLGVQLGRRGQFEQAVWHFAEAVRIAPDYPAAQRNLDRARQQLEQ